ncbi:CHRD domain-containing protein [Frigoribacterium sp. CFBP9030]|uniref:CHRD domain-containing protein n=1 Tax=Frigoribacterium sp. CFBP9030 TaxID=3096537 RepID=UPI002A6AE584|nr:CHRD domain-containing protein [Frigoribacterium sp. CFBP9030]
MNRSVRTLTIGGAAAAALTLFAAAPASAETEVAEPSSFTSAFTVMATPDQVINNDGVATPGQEGATGTFDFRINSDQNIICYDITLSGVTGDYMSPAKTATHIHEAAAGKSGPPRIAFPNPVDDGSGERTSSGCMQGPFTTGVTSDAGADTGEGFTLAQIEANPAGFTGDSHTADFAAGVVRGQLTQVPVGGVDTGAGGAANASTGDSALIGAGAFGALGLLGAAGVLVARRHRRQES